MSASADSRLDPKRHRKLLDNWALDPQDTRGRLEQASVGSTVAKRQVTLSSDELWASAAFYGDRIRCEEWILWFSEEQVLVNLDEAFALPIDIAMAVRRRGLTGVATPEGRLTRYEGTTLGRLSHEMEAHPEPAVLDQGFQLLEMDGETLDDLNRIIDKKRSVPRRAENRTAWHWIFRIEAVSPH